MLLFSFEMTVEYETIFFNYRCFCRSFLLWWNYFAIFFIWNYNYNFVSSLSGNNFADSFTKRCIYLEQEFSNLFHWCATTCNFIFQCTANNYILYLNKFKKEMKLERPTAVMTCIIFPAKLHISKYMWLMFLFIYLYFEFLLRPCTSKQRLAYQ
jgi:hypothetical protein